MHSKAAIATILQTPGATRVVNVQQPWADLLADGVKTTENRSTPLPWNARYMLIQASKCNFNNAEWARRMEQVNTRCAALHLPEYTKTQADLSADDQCIIALAKVTCVNNHDLAVKDVWNTNDKFAWQIDEVIRFKTPIPFGKGSLSVRHFLNCREDLIASVFRAVESM